jgi:50S ribosomal subunit-associated GTPase HflX
MTAGDERPGKGGRGEYVVDVKFRDLKCRMAFIEEKLDEAKNKRELYHQQPVKTGMPIVSLVGYTRNQDSLCSICLSRMLKSNSCAGILYSF